MGGLTCALALAKRGFKNVDVYEYASDLGFVGAGIQLAPNMARVLDQLDVWKPIEAEAVDIEDTSVRGEQSPEQESEHPELTGVSRRHRYRAGLCQTAVYQRDLWVSSHGRPPSLSGQRSF